MIFLVKYELSIVAAEAEVYYEKHPCHACGQDVVTQDVKVVLKQVITDTGPIPLCDLGKGERGMIEKEIAKQFKKRYP